MPMLQVRVHGPGDVRVDDVPEPDPGPRDAVVRIAACGICGSDLTYITMGGLAGPTGEPMCLGHEMAGTVDWVGDEVTGVRVGDRVVVQPGDDDLGRIGNGAPQGGLTPRLLVTEADRGRLHPVPDHLPLDVAAFAEPLAVGMHAAEQADVRPGDGICVFGCGPVGLAAVAALVDDGHDTIVAVDLSATRRRLAMQIGAQAALDPTETDVWAALADLHGTTPFLFGPTPATAAFIEASGSARVITDVIDHARRWPALGGRPAPRADPDELPHRAHEGADDPRLDRVPGPLRRRHRPARPSRSVGSAHPPLRARTLRRRPRHPAGRQGLRQGPRHHGPGLIDPRPRRGRPSPTARRPPRCRRRPGRRCR
ncbi:MAG: alcohol dehydrogenase catalytic domain-containing protein [Acidimicrobiales bacterium]